MEKVYNVQGAATLVAGIFEIPKADQAALLTQLEGNEEALAVLDQLFVERLEAQLKELGGDGDRAWRMKWDQFYRSAFGIGVPKLKMSETAQILGIATNKVTGRRDRLYKILQSKKPGLAVSLHEAGVVHDAINDLLDVQDEMQRRQLRQEQLRQLHHHEPGYGLLHTKDCSPEHPCPTCVMQELAQIHSVSKTSGGAIPLESVGLSKRTYSALRDDGFRFLEEVAQRTDEEMLRTPNFGRKGLNEVKEVLQIYSLRLGQ